MSNEGISTFQELVRDAVYGTRHLDLAGVLVGPNHRRRFRPFAATAEQALTSILDS